MTFPKLTFSGLMTPIYGVIRKFDEELLKMLQQFMTNLSNIFDHGISFPDNIDCQTINFTSNVTPNTEDTVPHTLRRVPTGFMVAKTDKAASIYASGTAWTETNVYLKSSAGTVAATIVVF